MPESVRRLLQPLPWIGLASSAGLLILVWRRHFDSTPEAVLLAFVAAIGVALLGIVFERLRTALRDVATLLRATAVLLPRRLIDDGVDRAYGCRADAYADVRSAIIEQADSGHGEILMCGVSLRDFLHEGGAVSKGISFLDELRKVLLKEESRAHWTVIVLDPRSEEVAKRGVLESGVSQPGGLRSRLFSRRRPDATSTEIELSIAHYRQLRSRLGDRIRGFAYNVRPFLFAVVTDEYAFEQRYVSVPPGAPQPYGRCYGDLLEVTRARKGSARYERIRCEVEYLRAASREL